MGHILNINFSLEVGDIVFNYIDALPFRKVAEGTGSHVNHVGIIVDMGGKEPIIAESKFPFSTTMPLSAFIRRSKAGRVEIKRFNIPFTESQKAAIQSAVKRRLGIFYDTGFNLRSKRQFCSRFVYEVVKEATGLTLGDIETLETLFARKPDTDIRFWRIWYFGKIPWSRETVTPASQYKSNLIHSVVSGERGNYKAHLSQPFAAAT